MIIAYLIGCIILYLVIRTAINNSRLLTELREIRKLLQENATGQVSVGTISNDVTPGNSEGYGEGQCPACGAQITEEDKVCPSCDLTLQ